MHSQAVAHASPINRSTVFSSLLIGATAKYASEVSPSAHHESTGQKHNASAAEQQVHRAQYVEPSRRNLALEWGATRTVTQWERSTSFQIPNLIERNGQALSGIAVSSSRRSPGGRRALPRLPPASRSESPAPCGLQHRQVGKRDVDVLGDFGQLMRRSCITLSSLTRMAHPSVHSRSNITVRSERTPIF